MNTKLITVLAAVCLLLMLIILGEWWYAEQAQKTTLSLSGTTDAAASDEQTMPEIALIQDDENSFEDLATRPLFIKGRKPVNEPPPEEEQAAPVVTNTFDWQLNGVYTTKNGLSALLSRVTSNVPKDNYRKIITGAEIDGWKLTEIQGDKAILKQGDQQKELLLRKPKPKELPPTPSAPNPSNAPNRQIKPNTNNGVPSITPTPTPAEGELEINNENL